MKVIYYAFVFIFLSLTGPGLPLYTLMDNRGSGVGLYTLEILPQTVFLLQSFQMSTHEKFLTDTTLIVQSIK